MKRGLRKLSTSRVWINSIAGHPRAAAAGGPPPVSENLKLDQSSIGSGGGRLPAVGRPSR